MAWIMYPENCYKGDYNTLTGTVKDVYIHTSSNLWTTGNDPYGRARVRVDYTIDLATNTAKVIVKLQVGRINGDWGSYGSGTATIDGTSYPFSTSVSSGCAERSDSTEDLAIIPNAYFTTLAEKTYTLTANSNGKFSKTITVKSTGNIEIFKVDQHTVTISFSGGWTSVTAAGTLSITDNGDNTYTVKGKAGKAGTNNSVTKATLLFTGGNAACPIDQTEVTRTATIPASQTADTYRVSAKVTTEGTYNSITEEKSADIVNYKSPSAGTGKPYLSTNSFKNGRLTIKQNWIYAWTGATAGNSKSPIKGYRFRLYKKTGSTTNSIPIKGSTGTTYGVHDGSGNYYYDRDGNSSYTLSFSPSQSGFKPGDIVYLSVTAYSKNGDGTKLLGPTSTSDKVTVQNAGVMHVRKGTSWVEGVVFVRKDTEWVEAESVKVRNGTSWVEST